MGNHWRNYACGRRDPLPVCGNRFDLCTIINGKSGRCSENCKYCAQSACYHTEIEEYPLLAVEKIKEQAKYNEERGVLRYSIVTSGKALNDTEVEHVCESVREIHKESKIKVCVSGGLLNETQFRKLKQAASQECIIIWRHPDRIFRMSVPLILMKTRSQRSAQLGKPE